MDIWKVRIPSTTHNWFDLKPSSSTCDLGEHKCAVHTTEPRLRCATCHVIVHEKCLQSRHVLTNKCKETYLSNNADWNECSLVQPERHQFEVKFKSKGKCDHCKKAFSKSFGGRKTYIMQCLWCKIELHYTYCFKEEMNNDLCRMPAYVVPHTWIRKKLINALNFRRCIMSSHDDTTFSVYSGSPRRTPIVLFINKKSGGGQWESLYQQALWLLNPRQIFDLSISSPKFGLTLYQNVQNTIFVVAGGDGTIGWVLSVAMELGMSSSIHLAIIPLGTGNDLARSFNWGPGYTTEYLSDILTDIAISKVGKLDRWAVKIDHYNCEDDHTDVMNNYFSIGADARAALEFHESRNANPEKFNSRLWNKIYYAGVGGKDIFFQTCKDLSEYCILKCDDVDLTQKIVDKKISTLLFLNIDSYAGGRNPWGKTSNSKFVPQSCCDGLLEVIGLTYGSMVSTILGGSGIRLRQCRKADITILRELPVQVDGEPRLLSAGHILITLLDQVNVVIRNSHHSMPVPFPPEAISEFVVSLFWISDDLPQTINFESLKSIANFCGQMKVSDSSTLSLLRKAINKQWTPEWTVNSWRFVTIDSSGGYAFSKMEDEFAGAVPDWILNGALFATDDSHLFTKNDTS